MTTGSLSDSRQLQPTRDAWAEAAGGTTHQSGSVILPRDLYRRMVCSLAESHAALRWSRYYGCGPTDSWAIRDRLKRTLDAVAEVRP